VLVFTLRRAAKLELVVKGPGPGCEVAARLPVAGTAGENRFRFAGRPYGKPLAFGTYTLELQLKKTGATLGDTLVGIVRPGVFPTASPPAPRCASGARQQQPGRTSILASGPTASPPAAPASPAARSQAPAVGILGQVRSEAQKLPLGAAAEPVGGDEGRSLLLLALLVIFGGSLLWLVALVAGALFRGRPGF
jgi:hypothetical protein